MIDTRSSRHTAPPSSAWSRRFSQFLNLSNTASGSAAGTIFKDSGFLDGLLQRHAAAFFSRESALPALVCVLFFGALAYLNFITKDLLQYQKLAEAFLQGHLYFLSEPLHGWCDAALFQGRYYWPLGVLPALVALPLVWLGMYRQAVVAFFVTVLVFYLTLRIARKRGYGEADALWLGLAFVFGTSFFGVAALPWSWYFAHSFAVLFAMLAVYEYENRRRFALIGGFVGLAMLSRPTAGLCVIAFASMAAVHRDRRSLSHMVAGFIPFVAALFWYNFARFGSFLESGYNFQVLGDGVTPFAVEQLPGPLFHPANILINGKILLFGLPDKAALGSSVLLVSPFLFYMAGGRAWDRFDIIIAATVCCVALLTLAFRSTGAGQVGYRFSLDYFPLLFWLILRRRSELTAGFRRLIAAALIINLWLVWQFLTTRAS